MIPDETGDDCPKCEGLGRRNYPSTGTWRGGFGGRAISLDVCDECWGTGSSTVQGTNLRELVGRLTSQRDEACEVVAALRAQLSKTGHSWNHLSRANAEISRLREEITKVPDLAHACTELLGGYRKKELAAFHRGMTTVESVLRDWVARVTSKLPVDRDREHEDYVEFLR